MTNTDIDIPIPPAALEAGAKALCKEARLVWPDLNDAEHDIMRAEARAACLAMLKAWPGMKPELDWDAWLGEGHTPARIAIILPLPQKEPTND